MMISHGSIVNVEDIVCYMQTACFGDYCWQCHIIVHKASAFLPFHRYFLSIFEKTLRDTCGYNDYLPCDIPLRNLNRRLITHTRYWDWTKDWKDPASSPIWDKYLGFGGDGNPDNEGCVEDGQFAGFEVSYRAGDYTPHCLARSFNSDNGTGHFSGYRLRPEAVENTLEQNKYGDFLIQLETGSHNGIPDGINGDFHYFTAPNGKNTVIDSERFLTRLKILCSISTTYNLIGYGGCGRNLTQAGSHCTAACTMMNHCHYRMRYWYWG